MPVKRHSTAGAVISPAHGTDCDFARHFAFNQDERFLPVYQFAA